VQAEEPVRRSSLAVQPQAPPPRSCGGPGWATTSKGVPDTRTDNPNILLERLGRGPVYC